MLQRSEPNEAGGLTLFCPRSHLVFSLEQHADLTKSLPVNDNIAKEHGLSLHQH